MESKSNEHVKHIEKYLRKIDYIVRKKGREILNDFNLTIPQFTALQFLTNKGNMTIGELSREMSLACSTITDLVDCMEKAGLVVRKRDENDKRIVRVEVLSNGYDIIEKVMDKRREFLSSKLNTFALEDKDTLNKVLEELYFAMKE